MNLVIVSGPEATGKTAIGKEIAHLLSYQYQSKDTIKEALFNSKSRSTWNFSWYEKQAKDKFFDEIGQFVAQNKSVVIESNFTSGDRQRLADCINSTVIVTEIYCTSKGLTSFRRFVRRNEKGTRHKGHHDRRWYPKVFIQDLLNYINIRWPHKPLGLTNKLLIVDTTNFSGIDYKKVANFVKYA